MKTCVVAGGAGFIGSWLCSDMLSKGFRVVCVDNLITGNEQNLLAAENFTFVRQDVSDKFDISGDVDFVFHMASPASPIHYQKHPIETLKANSLGTMNLLDMCKRKNARFLYASSSEVYGEPREHPQRETYWGNVNSFGPRSCYDEGKRFSEALIRSYDGVDFRIARIFNTYGPRMNRDDGRVVPNFIHQALTGKPITIYGDGGQTRSFCYVSDNIEGLETLMFSNGAKNELMNIGNPAEITILELAETIKKLTGSESKIVFRGLPTDDPTRRRPDIEKAEKILGWKPKIGIEDGLRRTIEYFSATG